MPAIAITGTAENVKRLEKFGVELDAEIVSALKRASLMAHDDLITSMTGAKKFDPFLGILPGAGDTIVARTGQTRARLTPGGRVQRIGDRVFASVSSPDDHVRFLEEGGRVEGTPEIRIALAAAQTKAGVDRFLGREPDPSLGLFRYPTKSMLNPKSGKQKRPYPKDFYLVRAVNGALEFWYLLKRAVNIRGRHLFENARKVGATDYPNDMRARLEALVRKTNA